MYQSHLFCQPHPLTSSLFVADKNQSFFPTNSNLNAILSLEARIKYIHGPPGRGSAQLMPLGKDA